MAFEAVRQVAADAGDAAQKFIIQGMTIVSPIIFSDDDIVETVFDMRAVDGSSSIQHATKWFDFRISSITTDGKWSEHVSGSIASVKTGIGKL